jgi:hypothetical protein
MKLYYFVSALTKVLIFGLFKKKKVSVAQIAVALNWEDYLIKTNTPWQKHNVLSFAL